MADNITDLAADMENLIYNPAGMQQVMIQTYSDVSNGTLVIFDPTNPLVSLMEAATATVSAFATKDQLNLRKRYSKLSQDEQDLYTHMSDTDYLNRFAQPASATFTIIFNQADVIAAMIPDNELGYSYIEIPRDTTFTVADTTFSLQYPIQIRELSHGGLQIVYDISVPSPLQTLDSNLVTWEIKQDTNGVTYIFMDVDVIQVSVKSITNTINASVLTQMSVALTDDYYFTRAWYSGTSTNNQWVALTTTHSPLVYDANDPTVVLQVDGTTLNAMIPQVYTTPKVTNGQAMLDGMVRLDVYQTKGAINLVLKNYSYTAYSTLWQWLDNTVDTTYSAPLNSLSVGVYCNATVAGGSAELTVDQLRTQVINNTDGPIVQPITSVQASAGLTKNNYQLVNKIDNVTDLIFLATRAMPTPVNSDLITAAGSCMGVISFTMDGLKNYSYVIDNSSSMTITPKALYKDVNGTVTLVADSEIAQLANLSSDQKAIQVSANKYRYCPFHYVLDNSTVEFAVRAYYLDGPSIGSISFNDDNDTTGLQVTSSSYTITKSDTGYLVTIAVTSNSAYKALADADCGVLMMYTPDGEKQSAYLLGTLSGLNSSSERVFTFNLTSTFNVDSDNAIELTPFSMFTNAAINTNALLTQNFSLIYFTTAQLPSTWVSNEIDTLFPSFLVPTGVAGIQYETLNLTFGQSLDKLWTSARTTATSEVFQTYTENVPAYYTKDVYERRNGQIFWKDPVTGEIEFNILHHKGDPVLNPDETPVYKYVAGDPVMDAAGDPVVSSGRTLARTLDVIMIEGVYSFGTDAASVNYRNQIVTSLVSWITNDLTDIATELIEPAKMYYYPQQTLGYISVLADGKETSILAEQSLVVTNYVSKSVMNNSDLLQELTDNTISMISAALTNASVSQDSILNSLRNSYGADVQGTVLTGLGGNTGLTIFTVLDNTARCSIKKKLSATSDNSLIVVEDVIVNYLVHDTSTVTPS